MITIELYRINGCIACKVMQDIILNIVNNINKDLVLKIRNADNYTKEQLSNLNISSYPTTIIKEHDKEIARLVGTYPLDYVKNVINKCE